MYREIRYKVTTEDGSMTAGEIMREKLELTSREISRCKKFDDGVLRKLADDNTSDDKRSCIHDERHNDTMITKDNLVPTRIIDALTPGDELIVRIYEDNDNAGDIVPSDGEIDIVYEDEDIIVLNKEGDRVVHPSYAHYTDSLSNLLCGYFKRTDQEHVIRTIGRLDRETSGLVLFAKNRYSAALLSKQTKDLSRRKEYVALASGVFAESEGTVNAPIERVDCDRMLREVREDGKEAITHYRVIRQYKDFALIRLHLDTGRTHQIRVHMAHLGHPLLGDGLYGKEIPNSHGMTRAALHAASLEFVQPVTKEKIVLEAKLPKDISTILEMAEGR